MGIMEKLPIYTQKIPGGSVLLTATDKVFNWSRKSSIWYMLFGLACCAIEMMATGASDYDLDRLGLIFRGSPRQSDLMFIAGTVTLNMAPKIQTLYEQMAEPRYVIAMGNCACNGGPYYYDSYSTLKGADLPFRRKTRKNGFYNILSRFSPGFRSRQNHFNPLN